MSTIPLQIGPRLVGADQPLFVIADLLLDEATDLDVLLMQADDAAAAGASAVSVRVTSFAAMTADRPAGERAVDVSDVRVLTARAHAQGLAVIATPADITILDLLLDAGIDALKIDDGDRCDIRLVERAAATGRPLLLTAGSSSAADVADAVDAARSGGARGLAVLHGVTPDAAGSPRENLRALTTLASLFGVPVGVSDRGANPLAAPLTVALGGSLFEKPLTRSRIRRIGAADGTATREELGAIVRAAAATRAVLGDGGSLARQRSADGPRRRLVAARDLRPGERIEAGDVAAGRPAVGLEARRWRELVGCRLARPVASGEPFVEDDIETWQPLARIVA